MKINSKKLLTLRQTRDIISELRQEKKRKAFEATQRKVGTKNCLASTLTKEQQCNPEKFQRESERIRKFQKFETNTVKSDKTDNGNQAKFNLGEEKTYY